jgi:histone-lysine N-methyltransferase SETMAR
MIEAKSLVVYWQSKSHNTRTIHEKLVARFDENALSYSSVTNWLRRLQLGEDIFEAGIHPDKPSDGFIDFEILTGLTAFPFHSVRTLARTLKLPRSTRWDHLNKGPFVVKHLRWIPHRLEDEAKRVRVTMAKGLLQNLQQARHQGWRYFLTDDESWFFDATDFERMWLPDRAIPQSRPQTIISTPKVIVSIFWSPIGFPVITTLPPRAKFSACYFCHDIIPQIVEGMPFDLAISPRKLMLHVHHASRHRARKSRYCIDRFRIHPIDHPPYSQNLVPSDFYQFGKLNGTLAG